MGNIFKTGIQPQSHIADSTDVCSCALISSLTRVAQNITCPLVFSFLPRIMVLHLLITLKFFVLVFVHSSLRAIFLVCFAFFLKIGLVCPPKPFYFISYLLLP